MFQTTNQLYILRWVNLPVDHMICGYVFNYGWSLLHPSRCETTFARPEGPSAGQSPVSPMGQQCCTLCPRSLGGRSCKVQRQVALTDDAKHGAGNMNPDICPKKIPQYVGKNTSIMVRICIASTQQSFRWLHHTMNLTPCIGRRCMFSTVTSGCRPHHRSAGGEARRQRWRCKNCIELNWGVWGPWW